MSSSSTEAPIGRPKSRSRTKSSRLSPAEAAQTSPIFTVSLTKVLRQSWGCHLANMSWAVEGAVIVSLKARGVIQDWNAKNPERTIEIGFVIKSANGVYKYWDIADQFGVPETTLELEVQRTPPRVGWMQEVHAMGRLWDEMHLAEQGEPGRRVDTGVSRWMAVSSRASSTVAGPTISAVDSPFAKSRISGGTASSGEGGSSSS